MKSYPYTEDGIKKALKELFNSDSPIVQETLHLFSSIAEVGKEAKGRIRFETADGKRYLLRVTGTCEFVPFDNVIRWETITSIEEL